MRILMVNKFLYPKGGAETYLLKIGKYLEENGHNIEYFGMNDKKNIVGNNLNLYTTNMDFHNAGIKKLVYPFKIVYNFEAKRKIKKVIKDFRPDVIHMNNINFKLTPSIIDAAKRLNIPVIQTVHDYQMICPNHLLFDVNNKKICEKCINGNEWNCTKNKCIHGSRLKSIIGSIEAGLYKIKNNYDKVDCFICPSKFLEEKLLTNNRFKDKTFTIHNFIELGNEFIEYKKKDYVLFFGRLSEEKGLDMFLEACKKLPEIKFKIAGTGPLESICKGINNVEFVGFKTGRDLEKLIGEAKFSVYPSIWYENCPMSILESESLGTPVVTMNHGGMKELIEPNETGILVKDISSESLGREIKNLYNDDKKIKYMSEKCIEKRRQMISIESYCNQIIDIYKNVCCK